MPLAGGSTFDDRSASDYNDTNNLIKTTDSQDSGRSNKLKLVIRQAPLMRPMPGRMKTTGGYLVSQPKNFTWPAIVLTLMLLINACIGRQPEEAVLGTDQTLSGPATLICGQACSERAQCGLADEEETPHNRRSIL